MRVNFKNYSINRINESTVIFQYMIVHEVSFYPLKSHLDILNLSKEIYNQDIRNICIAQRTQVYLSHVWQRHNKFHV